MRLEDTRPEVIEATNSRFRREVGRFRLAFRCGDCAHDVPSAGVCSLGFPPRGLRDVLPVAATADGQLTFCKSFELGER